MHEILEEKKSIKKEKATYFGDLWKLNFVCFVLFSQSQILPSPLGEH